MFNSRAKGNRAELQVAKLIKVWWSRIEPDVEVVRTPLSGGWGGPSLRAGFKASGDLMTTAKRWPFSVEVKYREAWAMDRLLAGARSPVWGWWRQSQTQAVEMDAIPMLWVRQNRGSWRVMLPWEVASKVRRPLRRPPWTEPDIPDVYEWDPWALEKVDHGEFVPALVLAETVLATHPEVFAAPPVRGTSRR
jgi:hypothetical protein